MKYLFSFVFLFSTSCWADSHHQVPPQQMLDSMVQPADIVSHFMWKLSIIMGVVLLFAAFLKYMDYRINKNASPLRLVLILFISGAVLTGLPLADSLIEWVVPYFFYFIDWLKGVIQKWILK